MSIENRGENKWRFRIRKDGQNYSMNFFGTEKEAINEHKKFEVDIMRGEIGLNENMLFGELAQKVLDDYVRSSNLKYNTERIYVTNYNNHILPVIGKLKLCKITTYTIQKLINDLSKEYKAKTVENIATVISMTFKKAVEWGFIKESPCKNITIPSKEQNNVSELLSWEQIEMLFSYYDNEKNLLHKSAFYLGACCGLRNSEIRALEETDIDFINKTISINKQDGNYRNSDGEIVTGDIDTKTYGSKRIIVAPDFVLDTLNQFIKSQPYKSLDGKIFFNISTGKPITKHCLSKRFKTTLIGLGLPEIRFHDLRHIHATLLINSNNSIASVSKRMGHSKISTTLNTYTHSIDNEDRNISKSMEDIVLGIKKRAN